MTVYTFTMPAGSNVDDVVAAVTAVVGKPDAWSMSVASSYQTPTLALTYNAGLSAGQQTTVANTIASNPHPATTQWARAATIAAALAGVPTVLRNQATQAQGTTVTAGNNVAVTQTIVNDVAIFCARLADLLEYLGIPV